MNHASDPEGQALAPTLAPGAVGPLDLVFAKRGAQPFVLVASQYHYSGEERDRGVFYVDVAGYEAIGLSDTRGQFWATFEEADDFARPLAILLGLGIEYVL